MTQMMFKDTIIEEMKLNALLERKIYMLDEFDRESVFKIVRHLDRIVEGDKLDNINPKNAKPIELFIDSYGGVLTDCFLLISTIRKYQKQGYIINTIGMGKIMSAGFYTFMVGSNRSAYELCSLMVHDQRAFEYGYRTVRDKRVELKEWEKEWSRLKDLLFEYTLITDEQIEYYVERGLDWNMTVLEAMDLGVVDSIY